VYGSVGSSLLRRVVVVVRESEEKKENIFKNTYTFASKM
jgi:hypothetical protein